MKIDNYIVIVIEAKAALVDISTKINIISLTIESLAEVTTIFPYR